MVKFENRCILDNPYTHTVTAKLKSVHKSQQFDGLRFNFFSINPKVYGKYEHMMLKSSIVFNENVQKFDLHDSNFEPNWMKSTKLLYSL